MRQATARRKGSRGQRQSRAQGAVGSWLQEGDTGRAGRPAGTGMQSWEPPVPLLGNAQPALPSFCSRCRFSPSFSASPATLPCTFCSCRHSYLHQGEQNPPLLPQGSSAAPAPQPPAEAGFSAASPLQPHFSGKRSGRRAPALDSTCMQAKEWPKEPQPCCLSSALGNFLRLSVKVGLKQSFLLPPPSHEDRRALPPVNAPHESQA